MDPTDNSRTQAATVGPTEVSSRDSSTTTEAPPQESQYACDSLWHNFMNTAAIAIHRPLEQMAALEMEAARSRTELSALHRGRVEQYDLLQQKRDAILTDINQYLQPFTAIAASLGADRAGK